MNLPNLDRVVDTGVPADTSTRERLLSQLRWTVVPLLRDLQSKDLVAWYCFLLHPAEMMGKRELAGGASYIHLFLEPNVGIELSELARNLPGNFMEPKPRRVSNFDGIEPTLLRGSDWAYGWKMIGEASAWVVALIESHVDEELPPQQIFQFLHFITNPLGLGQYL